MTVDELIKLLLVLSVAISLLAISLQVARLVGSLASVIGELRRVTKNFGEISDMVTEDYNEIRGVIKSVIRLLTGLNENVIDPINKLLGLPSKVKNIGARRRKVKQASKESGVEEKD